MGLATAAYGGGAALFSPLLGHIAVTASPGTALTFLAVVIVVVAITAAKLFSHPHPVIKIAAAADDGARLPRQRLLMFWGIYFLGACGGLTTIAHATGIMRSLGVGIAMAQLAPGLIAFGVIFGSAAGGVWADRVPSRLALALSLLVTMAALVGLLLGTANGLP
jgi:hypothetical protein